MGRKIRRATLIETFGGRHLAVVPRRCDCCGASLDYLTAYNTAGFTGLRYRGVFCVDCALGLIPEFVALGCCYGGGYGVDFERYDVRCGGCGMVSEFGCGRVEIGR